MRFGNINHPRKPTTLTLALMAATSLHASAQLAQVLPPVEIIASTPLPGMGQPRNEIAAPVQSASSRDLERSGALELGDFLNRRLGSVHVNEMQGNPFQMDVSYRGYTASPLLGTPQGLSVYMDGVRMNQPFGDVVSWDLIPRSAIASMTLMPGSNPLFGLNTLGGALSVQTKDGSNDPGTSLQATLGSNARRSAEFEHGGANAQGLDWYLNASLFQEAGWRKESPSDVRQFFGKLGWRSGATDLKLTLVHADNQLSGNGLQEQRVLALDRTSVYTKPDLTQNRSTLLSLAASHAFSDALQFSGTAYYRDINSATVNGDINEAALSQDLYQSGEDALNTPFPYARCLVSVSAAQAAGNCNGLINRTRSTQQNYGVSGQLTELGEIAGAHNRFVAGAGVDASRLSYAQSTQLAYLNPDHGVTGVNAFADGSSAGAIDGVPFDTRVELNGRIQTWSVYASDTLSLQKNLHLTLSGRYNSTTVENRDSLHALSDSASLAGDHRFARFNPAIGLTFSPSKTLNAYAGYSQSSRAPTTIELGCANPDQPCKLPNAMAGDPPLKQVVTRTVEAGMRGTGTGNLQWNAGVFSAENRDDILFVADNQAGFGYFRNFGKTRRQGLELGLSGKLGAISLGAQYTWLAATYQSAETVNGSGNSSNDAASAGMPGLDGAIAIRAGDQIPLIPRQLLKLYADYTVSPRFALSAGMTAVASALARGNENNEHQADGINYLGSGRSAGYAVFDLTARLSVTPQWQVTAQINNLFDARYNTAAQLGATGFDARGNFLAQPLGGSAAAGYPLLQSTFYAPGAPRSIWLSLRYALDPG